jgi:TRAP-type C4-dicarboxylate transport system substrate-binding protein
MPVVRRGTVSLDNDQEGTSFGIIGYGTISPGVIGHATDARSNGVRSKEMNKLPSTLSRLFLAVLALGVASTSPALAQQVQGPKVDWKYNVWGKQRAFTVGVETIAQIVSDKTGGNFTIKIYYGDQLGDRKQNLDNLKAGVLDMAQMCSSYHPGKNTALTVLNLPFLPIKNPDVEAEVHEAAYEHAIVKKQMADKWNSFAFMSSLLPQYEFMGKGEPPRTLAGFNGMSVRALGGLGDAMEKLGARKSTVTATEVYQALDRGTVTAVSFPFTYAHVSYKIDEVADWFTMNLSPGTVDCPTMISLSSWNALPKQYQDLIVEAKKPAYEALKAAYKAADEKNLPKFIAKMQAIEYSDEQLAQFREVGGAPVWKDWVEQHKGEFNAQGLLDHVMTTAVRANQNQ